MSVVAVTPALLRSMPLPRPDDDADKDGRGRVLVGGGMAELPGSVLLAGIAESDGGASHRMALMGGALGVPAGPIGVAVGAAVDAGTGALVPEGAFVGAPSAPAR